MDAKALVGAFPVIAKTMDRVQLYLQRTTRGGRGRRRGRGSRGRPSPASSPRFLQTQ